MPYVLPQPVRPETCPYVVFKDLFSPAECAAIVALHHGLTPQKALVGGPTPEGMADDTKRISEIYWLEWNSALSFVFEKIAASVTNANAKWWGYHLAGLNEPLQLTHYKGEQRGHYDWHEDHGDTGGFLHRKLSCVMPLNDAFEGGDFEMFGRGKIPEMGVGTMIIFPSFRLHRVLPVTSGERWSLVNWVNGPPFC